MPGEFIARQGLISRGNVIVTGSLTTSGSLTTTGTITATTLVVETITSSISSITGSTNFGSLVTDTHKFTGSLNVTGALYVATGSVGIGTLNPSSPLEIYANPNVKLTLNTSLNTGSYQNQIDFKNAGTASAFIQAGKSTNNTDLGLIFGTTVEAMRLTGSIVGIGATGSINPDGYDSNRRFLTIQATPGAADRGAFIELVGTAGGNPNYWLGRIGFASTTTNVNHHSNITSLTDTGGSYSGMLSFATTTNATTTAPIERMRITSAGATLMYNDMAVVNGLEIYDTQAYAINTGGTINFGGKYNAGGTYNVYGRISGRKENATDGNSAGYLMFATSANGVSATERARITSGGNLSFSTADAGIIFNKTSALNNQTLNDYEYGTWTPKLYQSSTELTSPTTVSGYYIKIGKMVYFGFYFYKASGAPSIVGDFTMRNLPFSIQTGTAFPIATGYTYVNSSQISAKTWWQGNFSTYLDFYGGSPTWSSGYVEMSGAGVFYASS
jgi:hypothetical protein